MYLKVGDEHGISRPHMFFTPKIIHRAALQAANIWAETFLCTVPV
jgi:hypothetical protein